MAQDNFRKSYGRALQDDAGIRLDQSVDQNAVARAKFP